MALAVLVGVYGLVLGSFYNVVIYRMPLDIPIYRGRSVCTQCGKILSPLDLVPVFSWLFLRGKCRYCKTRISIRYPVIELATAVLMVSVYMVYGISAETILYIPAVSMLLITAVIDFEHMVILDSILLFFTLLHIVVVLSTGKPFFWHLLGAVCGFALYAAVYFLAKLVYKKEAFGFGDVLLLTAIGFVVGPQKVLLIAGLAFVLATVAVVFFKLLGKKLRMATEIPFGPYICITAYIFMLAGDTLIALYLNYMYA